MKSSNMKGARERGKVLEEKGGGGGRGREKESAERGNGDDTRGESLKAGVEDKIAPVLDTRVRN